MNRIFDAISLFVLPVGFLVGLVVLMILELFGVGFWLTALILAVASLLFIAWDSLENLVSFDLFSRFLHTEKEREMHARIDARDRKIARIAFALGLVMAFIAAQFWSPLEISKVLIG